MVALLAVTVNFCRANWEAISRAGGNMAVFSAVLGMPDAGIDLLRDRFRGEIYGDDDLPDTASEQEPSIAPSPWPPPQVTEPETTLPPLTEPPTEDAGESKPATLPRIPTQYAAPVISENFAGYDTGSWIKWLNGYIKNDTTHEDEDVLEILDTPWATAFEDPAEPQVLIVHTHATESYEQYDRTIYDTRNTWRSTDNALNMVAVGDAMAEVLEQNGVAVLHDTTQHDYPSYNGSYERAAETIQEYLDEYPSIKVVLDLHRDAMQRDDAIVKAVATVEDKKVSQIMIIAACDDGTMDVPAWRENLRFAALFQEYMERDYPELTRPIFFCYRKYNMDMTPGSLLLEFGSNANTLEEALNAARMAGQALSNLIFDNVNHGEVTESTETDETDEIGETSETAQMDEAEEAAEIAEADETGQMQ
jgi:stage II sporulation protein P